MTKTLKWMGAAGASLFAALPAFAQEAAATVAAAAPAAVGPIKAPTVEQMAGMVDKGDTTWMLISSALVSADVRTSACFILWRPRSHKKHAQPADAGLHDRIGRSTRLGHIRL